MKLRTRKRLVLTLAFGALAVPASAMNIGDIPSAGRSTTPADRPIPALVPAGSVSLTPTGRSASGDGFDWADAGVGFGGAAGLALLGTGSAAVFRRRRGVGKPVF